MSNTRVVWAIVAAGALAGGVLSGCSKSETSSAGESTKASSSETSPASTSAAPTGAAAADISVAVGTGEFIDTIVGFVATAPTNDEASAKVIKACEDAGGVECTSDEVTNENLCIVSVASDSTDVVAGGAGKTIEEAKQDALNKAKANGTPEGADAVVVVSDCPS